MSEGCVHEFQSICIAVFDADRVIETHHVRIVVSSPSLLCQYEPSGMQYSFLQSPSNKDQTRNSMPL